MLKGLKKISFAKRKRLFIPTKHLTFFTIQFNNQISSYLHDPSQSHKKPFRIIPVFRIVRVSTISRGELPIEPTQKGVPSFFLSLQLVKNTGNDGIKTLQILFR